MKNSKNKGDTTRRDFLKTTTAVSTGAVLGGLAMSQHVAYARDNTATSKASSFSPPLPHLSEAEIEKLPRVKQKLVLPPFTIKLLKGDPKLLKFI